MVNVKCFDGALKEVIGKGGDGGLLEHGFLTPELGKDRMSVAWDTTQAMAWVRYQRDGVESVSIDGLLLPLYEFKARFQPTFVRSYSFAQAQRKCRLTGSSGPWDTCLQSGRQWDANMRHVSVASLQKSNSHRDIRKHLYSRKARKR